VHPCTIYLPRYSGTYNFQGVEHLQMRFRAPMTVTKPLTDPPLRRLHSCAQVHYLGP
jgi:hypothetical protein